MNETTWVDYVFGGDVEGYVYVMFLKKKDKAPVTKWYKWPEKREALLKTTIKNKEVGDVYYCPSLFKSESGKKVDVIGSWVSWADMDHNLKTYPEAVPPPGLVVGSGTEGRSHRYWRAAEFQDVETTEGRNLFLVENLRADPGGWDSNQLLRVPGTLNFKTATPRPVTIRSEEGGSFRLPISDKAARFRQDFELLPLDELLVRKGSIPKKVQDIYLQPPVDRSASLMKLAFELSENGWEPDEVYTLLYHADERLGKFSKRDDKCLRLNEIVSRSLLSVSFDFEPTGRSHSGPKGRKTLRTGNHKIKWIYEGLLREGGFLVVAGRQGVGKSQLAMQLGTQIALGKKFLDMKYESEGQQRVLVAEHEMDDAETDYILRHHDGVLTTDEMDLLEESMIFNNTGMAQYLDQEEYQKKYEDLIEELRPTGLIIDTLSASISTSLKDDVIVRKIFDWIDKIRVRYGVWVVLITHPRKPPAGFKKYELDSDDIYGDSIITQRPSTAVILSKMEGGQFAFNFVKGRQRDTNNSIYLEKDHNLWYKVIDKPDIPIAEPKKKKGAETKPDQEEVEFEWDYDT